MSGREGGCSGRVAGVLVGLALVVSALAPAVAGARVYWTTDGASRPRFVNLDGSGPVTEIVNVGAFTKTGLAVGPDRVYYTNFATGDIGYANLDGTGAVSPGSFITGASNPWGVAVRDGVYWANSATGAIGRADLDGTGENQTFITGGGAPRGVAVDGAHVYWANNATGSLGRASLDGTGVDQGFIGGLTTTVNGGPTGLAVDAAHVYWANNATGSVGRANLDGTGVDESFITGAGAPAAVAVDTRHIYWTNYAAASIGRANLDGSDVRQDFVTTAPDTLGLAVAPQALVAGQPAALTFGAPTAVPQGTVSVSQQVTYENRGTAKLEISSVSLVGANPDEFTFDNGCSALIAPGASCVISVRFAPREQGARSATLTALTNAPGDLATQLSGTAGPPPPPPGSPPASLLTPPAVAPATPTAVVFGALVRLPPSTACVSRRTVRLRLRNPAGGKISSVQVRVNRKRLTTVTGRRLTVPIDLRNLPKGRFTVDIRVKLADGRIITGTRRYRTCVPKRRSPT